MFTDSCFLGQFLPFDYVRFQEIHINLKFPISIMNASKFVCFILGFVLGAGLGLFSASITPNMTPLDQAPPSAREVRFSYPLACYLKESCLLFFLDDRFPHWLTSPLEDINLLNQICYNLQSVRYWNSAVRGCEFT